MRSPRRNYNRAKGLTLIELVVVLTILVALGSLLVPVATSMLGRTHMAKCSTTIPEITKVVQTEFAATLKLPDTWDSLVDTVGTAVFDGLPGGGNMSGQATAYTLTADDVAALANVGITEVVDAADAAANLEDVTLDSFPPGSATRALADGGTLVELTAADVEAAFFLPSGTADHYILFGLGNNSSLVGVGAGNILNEAPTHFGDTAEFNPRDAYQRYGFVVGIIEDGTGAAEEVVPIGACAIHGGGIENAEEHRREFWELSE